MSNRFVAATVAAISLAPVLVLAADLRIGLQGDPDVLDPAVGGSFLDRVVFAGLCDKLVDIDRNLAYVPQLATEWAWSADGLTLSMKLRPGAVFHDGEPLDALAVKANIGRAKTMPTSRRKAELAPVAGIDVDGPLDFRFRLSRPYAPLVGVLTDRGGMVASPKALDALGPQFATRPVCSGPYRFVERVAQDRIVLKKFDRHWDAAAYTIDTVTYLPIPDSTVRTANLRSGSLGMIERVAPTDLPDLKADRRIAVVTSPSTAFYLMSLNVNAGSQAAAAPTGRDKRVREALELAIDRTVLNKVVFDDAFIPSNQPWAPGSPFYAADFPVPKRDLARAKALLKQAGIERPAFTFLVPTSTVEQQVAQVIQSMAAEAGFEIKLETMEATTIAQKNRNGDFQASINIWSGRPDPDGNVSIWLACDGFVNWGKYCNPKLDDLLEQARSTTVLAERRRLYREAAAIFLEDRPFLFLYHLRWFWAHSAKLSGFESYPDGVIRLKGMKMAN